MLESPALARPSIENSSLKAKWLLGGIPVLITGIVMASLLLFSVNWVQVAIVAIPIALILYLAVSQISARLVRPASQLAEQVHAIANGDHSRSVSGEGEFSSIALDINRIVRELRASEDNAERMTGVKNSASKVQSSLDELKLSYDNLIVVSELGQQIIASLKVQDIANTAYETLNTMMDASTLDLATVDRENGVLHMILSIDSGLSNDAYSIPLHSQTSFGAWSASHGREIFLEDIETNYARYIRTWEPPRQGADRIRSLICVPMLSKGETVGVVIVGSYRKSAFTTYHLDMLKSLALYIAVALDNASAYEKLDRALVDLQTAQRQLIQAEKMSSLGLLTAGIAHEINNPINFVSANIGPLRRNLTEVREVLDSYRSIPVNGNGALSELKEREQKIDLDYTVHEITELLNGIEEGARRTAEIVQGLRNFSRTDEQVIKAANIEQGIDSTLTLLHNKYKDHLEIVKAYGGIPEVECYLGQINQVFMNILSNAIQAIIESKRESGKIWIRTVLINDHVQVRIRDNGTGMPEEVRKKIFDPFFTTKEVGVGTGLGLSISFGIIEKHEGTIEVESELGVGTEFIITLPIHQSQIPE